ncbi:MAG: glycolate oxidase subunit GlcF [Alphaproteobacteria bacterium]
MKTDFSIAQLANPEISHAQEIIGKCVHCGFCTAHCPTYQVLGNELDSPRGRIQLFKDVLEQDRPATAAERVHLDRCLTCGACNSVCPSGVDYLSLAEIGRAHIEGKGGRPVRDRLERKLLAGTMRWLSVFRIGLRLAPLGKWVAGVLPARARRMLAVSTPAPARAAVRPGWHRTDGAPHGKVGLFQSCVQPALRPDIDAAAVRVLNRLGFDVFVGQAGHCCGALDRHLGHEQAANKSEQQAARVFDGVDLDAITYTVSGCGPTLMGHEGFPAPVRDLASLLAEHLPKKSTAIPDLKVAVQAPCTQQHGAKLPNVMVDALGAMGFEIVPLVDPHLCCGAAGTYTVLQPALSDELGARKAKALSASGADIAVSANIGCLTHLERFETPPMLHWIELADWALGGPVPQQLSGD